MPNIIQFNSSINKINNQHHNEKYSVVNKLYNDLINSGFSCCAAHHEAMKLLLISNPNLKLSDLSQLTFEIINPEICKDLLNFNFWSALSSEYNLVKKL